jgi:transcriptional regulator with XRE-family HTH domain
MQERGIPSVVVLCREAGVSRNTLYNWEGGVTAPALDELEKVATRLDVPLSHLVDAWSGRLPNTTKDAPPEWARRLTDELKTEIETTRTVVAETLAREIGQSVGADLDRLLSRLLDERAP